MFSRALAVLAVANLTSAVSTLDQSALPAFDARLKLRAFSFDSADGTYASRNVPIDCHINAIRLQGRFTRLGTASTQWQPSLSLSIEGEQKDAIVRITVDDFKPPINVVVEDFDIKARGGSSTTLYQTFSLETPVPILASWSPEGLVTFNVQGETRIVRLEGPVRQATITGSTGAGTFDPIELGTLEGTAQDMICPKNQKTLPSRAPGFIGRLTRT